MTLATIPAVQQTPDELKTLNTGGNNFMPTFRTFDEVYRFCALVATSDMVPKAYKGKAADVMVACQFGAEIGLKWMQALQSIAVINGTPSIYGDAALALVRASNKLAEFDEWIEVDGIRQTESFPIMTWAEDASKIITAKCFSRREGDKHGRLTVFGVDDAKRASLWMKAGPWTNVPQRMLMWRARGWNLRDQFGDVLKGLAIYEEAIDIEPVKVEAAIAAQSQPATKGAQINDALAQVAEQRGVDLTREPEPKQGPAKEQQQEPPKQEQNADQAEAGTTEQTSVPSSEQAKDEPDPVLAAILAGEAVLKGTAAGQKALAKIWGVFKVRLVGAQQPIDVIPAEQRTLYLKQVTDAVDAQKAGAKK